MNSNHQRKPRRATSTMIRIRKAKGPNYQSQGRGRGWSWAWTWLENDWPMLLACIPALLLIKAAVDYIYP